MNSESRRAHLRRLTSESHARLDRTVGTFASAADYRRYLTGMAAFRLPLEKRLSERAVESSPTHSLIGPALVMDLADVGLPPPSNVPPSPGVDTIAARLGVLYVLEGSALGARVLRRRALELGFDEAFGARHLALQAASSSCWRELLEIIESQPETDAAEMMSAALEAFASAQLAFEGVPDVAS